MSVGDQGPGLPADVHRDWAHSILAQLAGGSAPAEKASMDSQHAHVVKLGLLELEDLPAWNMARTPPI